MTLTAWRIVKQKYLASQALDGEGARLYGGRWNSRGVAVVYAAQSQALAVLEMLVHLDAADLLMSYVFIGIRLEEEMISDLTEADLPLDWRSEPPPSRLREIGDIWVASNSSLALRVPSAVIPAEYNYILNPKHPDFKRVKAGTAIPYRYDPRLVGRK